MKFIVNRAEAEFRPPGAKERPARSLETSPAMHDDNLRQAIPVEAVAQSTTLCASPLPNAPENPQPELMTKEIIHMTSLEKQMRQKYGLPMYENDDGDVTGINERYWAGLYASEHRVLYERYERTFYQYDHLTGLWRTVTPESICESIAQRIFQVSKECRQVTLEKQITQQKLKGICGALTAIVEKTDPFGIKDKFIHVANRIIRFTNEGGVETGSFSPEDYSRNQSPIVFDPEARCPRFLNELIAPALSVEDAGLVQRWVGLALYGYNLPQRFLILDGMPAGGKGTLVRIIEALVGTQSCCQLRPAHLESRFELYRYKGKTLLTGPDVPGDFLNQTGAKMLKALVGGDPLTGEAKGSNATFPMHGCFNVVMTSNSRLQIRLEEDSGAWRRRLLIVRYERPPVSKRVPDFDKVLLRTEGAGILNWAIEGFVTLLKELDEVGDFKLTDAQKGRIDSLLQESDSLRIFVETRIEPHEGDSVTISDLVEAYTAFCSERGWNSLPQHAVQKKVPDLMLEKWRVAKSNGLEREGVKHCRGWRNVRLKGG